MADIRVRVASPDTVPAAYRAYIASQVGTGTSLVTPPPGTPAGYLLVVQADGTAAWVAPSSSGGSGYDGGTI